jgi:conjugal transfer mating pair stabilization protein TraG
MAMTLSVFTIGGGDLILQVFNAVAAVFNNKSGIGAITSLGLMFGGIFSLFEFSKTHDFKVLMKWAATYVLVTSLILYPKATVVIEDRTGIDIKPRIVDNVPLSLALFASFTSRIGIGLTEMIETVFHLPEDMAYNKTGMLMGSKLVLASKNFQITDPEFNQTLNEFMQQCVFYDLLLKKYTIKDLINTENPWEFIKAHTSQARAFPLNGQITICNVGAGKLDSEWKAIINQAAAVYGGQILGKSANVSSLLYSHLSEGYNFLTNVSMQGEDILKTNLLANSLSNALSHYGANANAPAALQAYEDTKSELQARATMDQTGRQAAVWMQYFKNIIEAVFYSAFIFIYFLSYFPFGASIVKNYLCGLFVLQALAPMYAIINFAATFLAQNRSMAFIASDPTQGGLSIANISGITQANADAMAVAGYLMWPVTLGGAIMLFRGLPSAVQSMGQLMGGVVQHAGSHVVAESVGGNISTGNANFGNQSMNNMNANHWDSNLRYAAGAATFQTGTGSSVTHTAGGNEVLDNRGGLSNLPVSINVAESTRMVASHQAQSSLTAALNKSQAAGEQYSAGLRQLDDYSHQQSQFASSGNSYSQSHSTGFNKSAHEVSQLVDTFAKEHHVSHEKASQVLGQVYADAKAGVDFLGTGGGVGAHASASLSGRSAFGSLYNDAHRFSQDHNFSQTVDSAHRAAQESHYRDSTDQGDRIAQSFASSFDKGDSYRIEAANQLSKAQSYSSLASTSAENAASINANYTQEFYEWMRHQPAPASQYGQGTWSRSAIDNLGIHEPAELQKYADRYVQEKTGDMVHSFEQTHHLSHGNQSVQAAYQHQKSQMASSSHVNSQYEHFNHDAIQKSHVSTEPVNTGIKNNVEQNINQQTNELNSREAKLKSQSAPLDEKVHQKIDGQVFGSLNGLVEAKKLVNEQMGTKE